LCTSFVYSFNHKYYCGQIGNVFGHINFWGEVIDPNNLHCKVTGSLEVEGNFAIYKWEDTRFYIAVCTQTGWLCNEPYTLNDLGDEVKIDIDLPLWKGGDISASLLPCTLEDKDKQGEKDQEEEKEAEMLVPEWPRVVSFTNAVFLFTALVFIRHPEWRLHIFAGLFA